MVMWVPQNLYFTCIRYMLTVLWYLSQNLSIYRAHQPSAHKMPVLSQGALHESQYTPHVLHAGCEPTSTCAVEGVTHILVSMTRVSQNHHKINQHIKGQSTWPDLVNRLAWPTSRPTLSKNVRINDLA